MRTGVADRVRRETEIADLQSRRLAVIRDRRRDLDEHNRRNAGLARALRCDVGLAILNPDPPPDAEVAKAAGWTEQDVVQLRAELVAPPTRVEAESGEG